MTQEFRMSRSRLLTISLSSLLILIFNSGCESEDTSTTQLSGEMHLAGDMSAVYTSGRFVVFTPKPKISTSPGAAATSMAAATPATSTSMSASTPAAKTDEGDSSSEDVAEATARANALEESLNIVVEAPLGPDGTFNLSVDVEEPTPVYFYVLDAISTNGMKMAPVKGQQFILEPGNLSISMDSRAKFVVNGGYYNDAVFNVWKTSDEFLGKRDEFRTLVQDVEGETEEERRRRVDAYIAAQRETLDIEERGRQTTSLTHPDPLVRKLTLQTTWLIGPWYRESINRLASLMPDDPWVQNRAVIENERWDKKQEQNKIEVGSPILDFEGETLTGDVIALADVQKDSKLVLLEFWASWCGPCRTEIPHMKQAYEKYQDQGFEIISFTIDDSRDDWEVASEEEDLPWVNLGMGSDAEAPKKYYVTGVPINFLVNAESGLIVAKNLRQHHLDEALEEELL